VFQYVAFGRLNRYKINPSQELIAIGVTNTVGSCFGAFPATGSFSFSALQARSGVHTPLIGVSSVVVILVSLYGLTQAFFWIPNSVLGAIIIHAVVDLVAPPSEVFRFWRFSPPEFFIWVATCSTILFGSIEAGVYVAIGASMALLLFRIAHPRGSFLGRVSLECESDQGKECREIFIPIRPNGVNSPDVKVVPPAPGVLVYRFEESYLFPNCAMVNSALTIHIRENMRRGKDLMTVKDCDRPWHESGPRRGSRADQLVNQMKPWLHAIVLDFSAVYVARALVSELLPINH
jgi:sodium-independent sulfate anion transporter 11